MASPQQIRRHPAPSAGAGPDPVARFALVAASRPGDVAVRDATGALTFADLDRWSRRLASRLRRDGVRRGAAIGIAADRTVGLVVAHLATWRAGAVCVPLDPGHPLERRHFVIADAGVRHVLVDGDGADGDGADGDGADGYWPPDVRTVPIGSPRPGDPSTAGEDDEDDEPVGRDDAAYVVHTSGSTGRPKGVVATRGGVTALVAALERTGMYAGTHRTVAWNASIAFDASIQQWVRVCRGDTVVVVDEHRRTRPGALVAFLDEHGVQDLDITPSHWELMREELLELGRRRPLRLFIGGEAVRSAVWREIVEHPGIEAVNLYGPTECTVEATAAWFSGSDPTIGTPLPGVRAHVLDDRLGAADTGELYLGGEFVSRGYLGRPALTAQRFVPDPAGDGTRMYRTGDVVRRRGHGLEYAGRVDRQIKVSGVRVELGEVEAVMGEVPGVERAVVVLREGRLVGYAVGTGLVAESVHRHLATLLPRHALPALCVVLDEIPLTASGKTDLQALQRLPLDGRGDGGTTAPDTVVDVVTRAWADALGDGAERGGNFFALGGDSGRALAVIDHVLDRLGVGIGIRELYRHPHLGELIELVQRRRNGDRAGSAGSGR